MLRAAMAIGRASASVSVRATATSTALRATRRSLSSSNGCRGQKVPPPSHSSTHSSAPNSSVIPELKKRYGEQLFHRTRGASSGGGMGTRELSSSSTTRLSVPVMAVVFLSTAAGLVWLTMPPADKDVFLTANNLPTAKPTRGGPKTHGVYQTMTPEELAHGHVEEEQQKQEGTAVVAQGHGVGLHPAPALKEDEPTLPPVGNAESKNNVGTSSSSATPRPGAEPLGSQQQQAPTSPATPPPLQRPLVDPASNLIKSRYVLIGAGTASYSALTAIREREPHAEVLVITGERDVPYMRPPLSKELWQSEDDEGVVETLKFKDWVGEDQDLFYQPTSAYQILPPTVAPDTPIDTASPVILIQTTVTDMDVEAQTLTLSNGRTVKYGKVLLATGGTPRELEQAGVLPEGVREQQVTTFRTAEDFRQLHKVVTSGNKHIVIIGGGFLGSELACALARKGKKYGTTVTQVYPELGNMAAVFPEYLSKWTTSRVTKEGVEVLPNTTIARMGPVGKLIRLETDVQTPIDADHIITAIGISPNTQLARKANLEIDPTNGGILVNAELEARTNVFVAGDVASFYDGVLGRRRVEHHDHAILSGRVAGKNMTGAHRPYTQQSMFWSDLGPEIGYEAVGVLDSSLRTVGIWAKGTEKDTPKQALKDAQEGAIIDTTPSTPVLASPSRSLGASASLLPAALDPAASTSAPTDEDKYGKGVVFYLRDEKIVGVLLWNVFHRTHIARRLINERRGAEDPASLAALFKIHEE